MRSPRRRAGQWRSACGMLLAHRAAQSPGAHVASALAATTVAFAGASARGAISPQVLCAPRQISRLLPTEALSAHLWANPSPHQNIELAAPSTLKQNPRRTSQARRSLYPRSRNTGPRGGVEHLWARLILRPRSRAMGPGIVVVAACGRSMSRVYGRPKRSRPAGPSATLSHAGSPTVPKPSPL